ncbi:MAG TPA: M48 family metalloprotease [Myxococcaceae bacterium]
MRSLVLALLVGQAAVPPPDGAPQTSAGWLERGRELLQAGHPQDARDSFDQAVGRAETEEERAEALAERALAQLQLGGQAAAQQDAYDAVASSHSSVTARRALAVVSMDLRDHETAAVHAEVLVELKPDDGDAHALLAGAYLALDRNAEALAEAEKARALGADRPWFSTVEARAGEDAWIRRGWWAVIGMAIFLAAGLVLLSGLGSILSSREVGKLTHAQLGLLRSGETPSERAASRLYQAVLWFGTALFYVSIPMMVLLSLVFGGVLLYAVFQLPRERLPLVPGGLLIALGGAWAVVRSLFLPPHAGEEGRRLTPEEEPRLFEMLREVAQVATAGMVDRVLLKAEDTAIGVRESGGVWRVLTGRGERVLSLSFAALPGLRLDELKALLAHEYGHFSHGETRLTPFISRTTQSMVNMTQRMASLGPTVVVFSPVYWFLRLFVVIYLQVTAAHSQRRELLADRAAALAYGGDTFGRALRRYVELSDTFERTAFSILVALREAGHPCRDLFRCVLAAHEVVPPRLRALREREGVHRVARALDSHPAPYERIARVAGLLAHRPAEPAPAASVFRDPDALARELTASLVGKVDAVMQARGMRRLAEVAAPADEDETALAAAISLHSAALELRERREPGSEDVLRDAVERLEQVAGDRDPVLVEPLLELSRTHARKGDRARAERALERALRILEAEGTGSGERAGEIREMLKSLEAA